MIDFKFSQVFAQRTDLLSLFVTKIYTEIFVALGGSAHFPQTGISELLFAVNFNYVATVYYSIL